MISPARCERIWRADERLRPEGLRFADFWWLAMDEQQVSMSSVRVYESTAAALIRDACVLFLADNGNGVSIMDHGYSDFGRYEVSVPLARSTGFTERVGKAQDPTEALLLAVEAVLGLEPWVEQDNESPFIPGVGYCGDEQS